MSETLDAIETVETVEPATPSAVIDRISLVLDAFDGPGRLTLAQLVRRTGLPRSSAHRMLDRLVEQAERHVHARGRWNESHHAMPAEFQKASCQNQHGSDRRGPEQGSDEAHE